MKKPKTPPPAPARRRPAGRTRLAYPALIFATGAVTLALEVLASRIMTPYFGVSLYIWAGILSITLAFLAVGYRLGGRLALRHDAAGIEFLFLAAPAASAAAIVAAALVYPIAFPALAGRHLVLGSFIAGALLLALPLVALSAMNPLLIALARGAGGDAGAGRVFYVSTVGSVAGVLVTAFVFIPNVTNHRALFLLALGLAAASAAFAFWAELTPARRRGLCGAALAVAVVAAALAVAGRGYTRVLAAMTPGAQAFEVKAEYTSLFGNVKVVQTSGGGPSQLIFVQDGLTQNHALADGTSLSLYTYVLDSLARLFEPDARNALVLGLGAGVVPRGLKRRGIDVAVVEINRDALAAARHFGFDPVGFSLHWEDARTFVRRCRDRFDVVVIDLFHGDNTPDYLLTAEFFADVARCLGRGGAAVMNAFFDGADERVNRRLFATVAAAFPRLWVFRDLAGNADGGGYNGFIVATTGNAPAPARFEAPADGVPAGLAGALGRTLASGLLLSRDSLPGVEPVRDAHNVFTLLNADAQMAFRRGFAGRLPPHVLLN